MDFAKDRRGGTASARGEGRHLAQYAVEFGDEVDVLEQQHAYRAAEPSFAPAEPVPANSVGRGRVKAGGKHCLAVLTAAAAKLQYPASGGKRARKGASSSDTV